MITFLRGKVNSTGAGHIDVDVQGVGYRVLVTEQWAEQMDVDDDIFVFTHHHVREDAQQLLGFQNQDDRDWFELLLAISGIGPKGAMQIISGTSYDDFASAIVDEDYAYLSKLPGVGKKTAQRLVVELKDKILSRWSPQSKKSVASSALRRTRPQSVAADVLEALEALGYPERQVSDQVRSVMEEQGQIPMEELLRMTLQRLAK